MKFLNKTKEIIKERKFKFICFFWILISVQFVVGYNLQEKGYLLKNVSDFFVDLLKIIILSITFIIIHYYVLKIINKKRKKENIEINKLKEHKSKFWKYFLIIFICWIPTLLAFYPSIVSYDGGYQIKNYIFYNNFDHHPILITRLYSMFYILGINIGSVNTGMFLFSIFQMTFMAAVFSYAVGFIEKETNNKLLRNISIIFYALFPYNQLFSMITTKDVIFAGLFMLFNIKLYKMLSENTKYKKILLLIMIGVLMLLSRNNVIYTLIVSLPFLLLVLRKDKFKIIKVLSTFLIIIVIYKTTNNCLYNFTSSVSDEGNLRVTAFSQAIGRVARDKKEQLTEEEKEKISHYFYDYNRLAKSYKTNIADNSLNTTDGKTINKNKKEFFEFVFELGKKYPIIYVESFLDTTRGFWYICDNSFNSIWSDVAYEKAGALELYTYGVGTKYAITEESKLPGLKQFYKDMFCKNYYQNIPVIYIIFQPATYFYLAIAFLLYAIYKKDKNNMCIAICIFVFFASCYIANCSIVRYIYPVIVCTPLMAGLSIKRNKEGEV